MTILQLFEDGDPAHLKYSFLQAKYSQFFQLDLLLDSFHSYFINFFRDQAGHVWNFLQAMCVMSPKK